MKKLLSIMVVLAMVFLAANTGLAQLAVSSASLGSQDVYEINNMTPGSSKTFLGTRLYGPLMAAATTETAGSTMGADNVTAGETITTATVNITTGAAWGSSTTLDNGQQNQVVTFVLATDGGQNHKISPSTKTGFTSVTLNDAGDSVTMKYINSTVGWVVIGGEGYNIDSDFDVTEITVGASMGVDNVLAGETITQDVAVITTGAVWGSSTTLKAGYIGQEVTFVLKTDGGKNHTISPSTKTGFTSITMSDANDSVTLKYINSVIGWVIKGNSASTIN